MSTASESFSPKASVTALSLSRARNAPPVAVVATKSLAGLILAPSVARQSRVFASY
jgi:hypothetical protein